MKRWIPLKSKLPEEASLTEPEADAPNLLGAIMQEGLFSLFSLKRLGELRIANGLLLAPADSSFGLENTDPATKQKGEGKINTRPPPSSLTRSKTVNWEKCLHIVIITLHFALTFVLH